MAFQGVSVGIAAADADLWGFCGDAPRLTSAIRPGFGEARRCLMRSPRGTAADPARAWPDKRNGLTPQGSGVFRSYPVLCGM